MVDRHHTLLVEKGAGIGSGFDDAALYCGRLREPPGELSGQRIWWLG